MQRIHTPPRQHSRQPPITNRLRQLADLHHHQLINDDEYTRQHARILNEL
ncbi:hypothetical protein [Salinispora arenicola]|nr:hypothetical protein [Salinispora arenicola]NIL59505.1 hypothetical protein [Salinispora arenicola]NIL60895.1 hypothetical protein [Salinispora arenicola]